MNRPSRDGYCAATVQGGGFRASPCSRRAVVTRGGAGYCRQHDPEAVQEQRSQAEALFAMQRTVTDLRYARRAHDRAVVEAVRAADPATLPAAVRDARATLIDVDQREQAATAAWLAAGGKESNWTRSANR